MNLFIDLTNNSDSWKSIAIYNSVYPDWNNSDPCEKQKTKNKMLRKIKQIAFDYII